MSEIVRPEQMVKGTRYIVRDNNSGNPENRPYVRRDGPVFHPNGQPVLVGPNNKLVSLDYTGPFDGPDDMSGTLASVFLSNIGPIRFPNDKFTFYRDPTANALNNPRNLGREFGGKRKSKRKKTRKSKQYR